MKKILVIQQKMIGDVLLSSILCNSLRKAYPTAQIDYLVHENTVPVLENNPNIDNIIRFTEKHKSSRRAFLKLGKKIRAEKYDILIDAYSKLESWLLSAMSGAKQKISYKKIGRNFIYDINVPYEDAPKTSLGLAIERRLSLLKPLSIEKYIDPIPKLFLTNAEMQTAKNLFKKFGINESKKTVMISLLGSEEKKTYPLPFMAKMIDFIGQNYDVTILFNYFPKQIKDAKTILNLCSEKTKTKIYFDFLGADLRSFIAIMNECDAIIGNDGGAINMAKALNKPSFIIFSPWIEKKMWATFEDGINHSSVHLEDYQPNLFKEKTEKELKDEAENLYLELKPELIIPKLELFASYHLK
ncbi:glycosyltransferase family 9 protein [Flavobacterium sp.]|uniref:glycosyltransferase family 9 protein n=1 Tax=Flavobacterium sp. TaxID=239 RepID=UPI0025C1C028|nr:glycosyltransferase family 9 protein [Flavobacterium sp.]